MTKSYDINGKQIIDQVITIGDILENPYFDVNAPFELREIEPEEDDQANWVVRYSGDSWDVENIPPEVMVRPVRYITVVDNKLCIEYDWREE